MSDCVLGASAHAVSCLLLGSYAVCQPHLRTGWHQRTGWHCSPCQVAAWSRRPVLCTPGRDPELQPVFRPLPFETRLLMCH